MTSSASRPSASDADEGRGASSIRLRADALTLAYDAHVVSRNLDLDLAAGELTAIVGPNACGKSTLLRARTGRPRASSSWTAPTSPAWPPSGWRVEWGSSPSRPGSPTA